MKGSKNNPTENVENQEFDCDDGMGFTDLDVPSIKGRFESWDKSVNAHIEGAKRAMRQGNKNHKHMDDPFQEFKHKVYVLILISFASYEILKKEFLNYLENSNKKNKFNDKQLFEIGMAFENIRSYIWMAYVCLDHLSCIFRDLKKRNERYDDFMGLERYGNINVECWNYVKDAQSLLKKYNNKGGKTAFAKFRMLLSEELESLYYHTDEVFTDMLCYGVNEFNEIDKNKRKDEIATRLKFVYHQFYYMKRNLMMCYVPFVGEAIPIKAFWFNRSILDDQRIESMVDYD